MVKLCSSTQRDDVAWKHSFWHKEFMGKIDSAWHDIHLRLCKAGISATFMNTDFKAAEGCSCFLVKHRGCCITLISKRASKTFKHSNPFPKELPKHLNPFFKRRQSFNPRRQWKKHKLLFFWTEHLWHSLWSNENAQNRLQTSNKNSTYFWLTYPGNPCQNQHGFVSVDGRTMHSWLSCMKWIKFQTDDYWYDVCYQQNLQLGLFCFINSLYFSHNILELQNII